jgi:hypothetical protein
LTGIPYSIALMRFPAKSSFSAVYTMGGICGALRLLDQGFSELPDMAQIYVTGRKDLVEGKTRGLCGKSGGNGLSAVISR